MKGKCYFMNAKYLIDGKIVTMFLFSDMMGGKPLRDMSSVTTEDGVDHEVPLGNDENGMYFTFEDHKVYLNDFEHMSYEDLIDKIEEGKKKDDRWLVRDDDVLATFLKETDKVLVKTKLPAFDIVIPEIGVGLTSNNYCEVLTVPTEKRYKKKDWEYKITLEYEDKNLRTQIASQTYYYKQR